MERWEIVERRVLVVVGIALIALAVWLATDTESVLFAVLLAPIIFWVFWFAHLKHFSIQRRLVRLMVLNIRI